MSNTTTTKFVAVQPVRNIVVTNPKQPCAFEVKAGPQFFREQCKPTSVPGVMECELVSGQDSKEVLQPMRCATVQMNAISGMDVKQTITIDPKTGREIRTITQVPRQTTFTSTTQAASNGVPIPFDRLKRADGVPVNYAKPTPMAPVPVMVSGLNVAVAPARRDIGGGASTPSTPTAKASSTPQTNVKVGGASRAKKAAIGSAQAQGLGLSNEVVSLTRGAVDQETRVFPTPEQMSELAEEERAKMAALPPLSDPMKRYSLGVGDYGANLMRDRELGFDFPFKYRPSTKTDLEVLSYMINIVRRLRVLYPEDFNYLYDSLTDTPATLESATLDFFARMETDNKYYKRDLIFQGIKAPAGILSASPSASATEKRRYAEFSAQLRAYISTPMQIIGQDFRSPLTSRYLGAAPEAEAKAISAMISLYQSVQSSIKAQKNMALRVAIGREFVDDGTVTMAIIEDHFLSLLARLSYKGFALQTAASAFFRYVDTIMSVASRRYFSVPLIGYLNLYLDETSSDQFYYLPSLRKRAYDKFQYVLPQPAGWKIETPMPVVMTRGPSGNIDV